MFTWVSEPFSMLMMQQALLAVCLAAVGCAAIGVHVVLRRMAFMGDAMAHATLPGVVVGFLVGWNLLIGALLAALLAALGIAWASRSGRVNEDSAIGILYTGMFAVGIIMLNRVGSYRDLAHALLGNPLGVTSADLIMMACIVAVVGACLWLYRRPLAVSLIDAEYARSIGISPHICRAIVLILCACMVVVGIRVVGVILTAALIITPAASARLLCASIGGITLAAILISLFGTVTGMILSYHYDLAMGASMVLVLSAIFLLIRLASGWHHRGQHS